MLDDVTEEEARRLVAMERVTRRCREGISPLEHRPSELPPSLRASLQRGTSMRLLAAEKGVAIPDWAEAIWAENQAVFASLAGRAFDPYHNWICILEAESLPSHGAGRN